ncbi:GAF domain-containing sensor histidine kinase [Roseivivax sp. THAF30]|uniref:sensor histidine kinase n=1 Tax=Roseivivax sp. THAF30 TaxID=2587852 RepID=UPI001267D9D3|nr:GAF domain-containing sensor histidine kinase [Roseivivax sp. THAF30]QFT62861.1 Bacteriophytochrome [Roseivivax sp. THAF30]
MSAQTSTTKMQDHATFLAGAHDFQADIELLASSNMIGTILDTVMLATNMRFAGVARVTADRWVACRTVDEVKFGIAAGDEIPIESTFCQTVRDTSEMVVFGNATTDAVYKGHPIAAAFGIVSYASAPIFRSDGSFFGTLCAIDTDPKDVDNPRSVAMLQMFADLIGRSLETEERLEAQEMLVEHERRMQQAQEEFVAILGHDLRNPIAALLSGLRQVAKEPLTERGRDYLVLMRASLYRMNEMIDNLMLHAKSRLGAGITVVATPDAALQDAVEHVVAEVRAAAPEKEIIVDLDLSRPVSCDPARVAQAISNLVSNAISYGRTDAPVRIAAEYRQSGLAIDVVNEGDAIPPSVQDVLFQPFRRGSEIGSTGLGLGLHIASSIARAHNGSLSVMSGNGTTTFRFEIPLIGEASRS